MSRVLGYRTHQSQAGSITPITCHENPLPWMCLVHWRRIALGTNKFPVISDDATQFLEALLPQSTETQSGWFGTARYITKLGLWKGYWQIPLEETSKQHTAFSAPSGLRLGSSVLLTLMTLSSSDSHWTTISPTSETDPDIHQEGWHESPCPGVWGP